MWNLATKITYKNSWFPKLQLRPNFCKIYDKISYFLVKFGFTFANSIKVFFSLCTKKKKMLICICCECFYLFPFKCINFVLFSLVPHHMTYLWDGVYCLSLEQSKGQYSFCCHWYFRHKSRFSYFLALWILKESREVQTQLRNYLLGWGCC